MLGFLLISGNLELLFRLLLEYRSLNVIKIFETIDFIIYLIRGPVSLSFFIILPILLHSVLKIEKTKFLNIMIIIISLISLFTVYLFSKLSFDEFSIVRMENSFPSFFMMSIETGLFLYSIILLWFKQRCVDDFLFKKLLFRCGILSAIFFPLLLSDIMQAFNIYLNALIPLPFVFHPLYFSICSLIILHHFENKKRYCEVGGVENLSEHFSVEFLDADYFTKREKAIIQYILEGHGNKQIADELGLSIKTINNQIYNLYKKININSRHELFNLFYKNAEAHRKSMT